MAAAAVLVTPSSPFRSNMTSPPQRSTAIASSSRSKPIPVPSPSKAAKEPSQSPPKTFKRIRSSLEQTIRTATSRSKAKSPIPTDDATITARAVSPDKGKGKEKDETAKPGMFKRLESKVQFRRVTPSSVSPEPAENGRVAGHTSYVTPSLRQGSISSPALHIYSQPLPSPKSQSAIPASSSSITAALVSPTRDRTRRSSLHPTTRDISGPISLTPSKPASRHRSTKSVPTTSALTSPSTPNLPQRAPTADLTPRTPPRNHSNRDVSLPETPTPLRSNSRTRVQPSAPMTPRGSSPIPIIPRSRSRVVSPIRTGSSSPLPLSPPSSPTQKRSLDSPRRPSFDLPRNSNDSPRRPSFDLPRSSNDSPRKVTADLRSNSRSNSPITPRPRPISPNARGYSQNRHFNISTASLSAQESHPEHRETIRTATSMLCKELAKAPGIQRTEQGQRDWGEVEIRTRALVRLERMWGKSGFGASASNVSLNGGMSSSGLSAGGEERERRLFCEALRDGFVLCQLMNKLRSASIVRPDVREDGISRNANVVKFLGACSSYGLSTEELFSPDDLAEATSESLARVARTIIALIKFVDAPITGVSPYGNAQGTATSRAAASTPNLGSNSPVPVRKRWSPPAGLPTVRADSPESNSGNSSSGTAQDTFPIVGAHHGADIFYHDQGKIISAPLSPKLHFRSVSEEDDDDLFSLKPPARATSTRSSVGGDSSRESTTEPIPIKYNNTRQSVASSMSDTTTYSSLLEMRRKQSTNTMKYGTIRTVTTEATSESPSFTRTEGSAIAASLSSSPDDPTRKLGKYARDRRSSESPMVDLSRVTEEAEESSSSNRPTEKAKAKGKGKQPDSPALFLGKGKWPEDFMDALQPPRIVSIPPTPDENEDEDKKLSSSPISTTPPRKLAIVGGVSRNEQPFPRRPTHRARQSVDAPVLLPKETSMLRRDSSPESRIMLRRHSTKPAAARTPPYVSDNNNLVPFPRTSSGEHQSRSRSPASPDFKPPRGRFQSDVEATSSTRRRPISYDELAAKPTRFESMVNLGGPSGNASASDLLSREAGLLGSAVRKTLVIREEGKPPTHFQLGNCIGRGQFGSVYRALNLNTGQMVAVKRIRLEGLKEEEVTQLMKEVDLVKRLSHPSIVKYEGMARDADTLSIVLEYAENGSLGQTLKAFGKFNERLIASYVVKILEGLHYLHQSDVVHCDLKAANILTTKNGNVKLSDFGVSLNLRAMEREIKDVAGTPNWMAPEVIELKGASTKSDIWSLACTVIELLTGRPPYAEIANSMSVMFRIVEDDKPPIPEGTSALLQDFLVQCFNKDPTKRPSAEDLCEHQWLKKTWAGHKELRPQDSIPFLRRVSVDMQKSEVARYLSQIEMPESPTEEAWSRAEELVSSSPPRQRISITSRPPPDSDVSPREHSFVKTTFSKPMICRVCLLNVKKSAVLCEQCSLIAHSKCAVHAPPTCDLRAQLLLYAQYAEKGNPSSAYYNPMDNVNQPVPLSAASDVPFISHTPRTSLDIPPTSPQSPPTAFKFMAAFKRSRSSLTPEPGQASSSTANVSDDKLTRPQSLSSNSNANSSSLRSAVESVTGRKSIERRRVSGSRATTSVAETDDTAMTSNRHHTRKEKKKRDSNCSVQ